MAILIFLAFFSSKIYSNKRLKSCLIGELTIENWLFGGFAGETDVALVKNGDDDARHDGQQSDNDSNQDDEKPRFIHHFTPRSVHHRLAHCTTTHDVISLLQRLFVSFPLLLVSCNSRSAL